MQLLMSCQLNKIYKPTVVVVFVVAVCITKIYSNIQKRIIIQPNVFDALISINVISQLTKKINCLIRNKLNITV